MRLVVSKYERDEQNSLDCLFCDEVDNDANFTVITFYEESTGQVLVVCPEHLDAMVSRALERHVKALEEKDPFWYLTEDEDPWEDLQ